MNDKITEGTINGNNIYADNLVKVVTVKEWNELLNTITRLQHHISTVDSVAYEASDKAYGALDKADKAMASAILANRRTLTLEEEK